MKEAGIASKSRRRFVVHTTDSKHDHPVASNTLARRFDAWEKPNQAWCCDITYVPTDQGFLYLAAVIDLCSRKVVGWAMADHLRAEPCLDALGMALATSTTPRTRRRGARSSSTSRCSTTEPGGTRPWDTGARWPSRRL